MENKKKDLITWALKEFKSNLILNEQRWNFFPRQPYFDFRSSLSINNQTFEGRGVSSSQKQAISASIAEALERFAVKLKNDKSSSSGYACHTDKDIAKLNSKQELIERHFVMLYSLGHANIKIIENEELPTKLRTHINFLNEKDIGVSFATLYSDNESIVVICQISGLESLPKFGLTFGSACKKSLSEGMISSFLEVLPNIAAFHNQKIKPITLKDFKKIRTPTPLDHLALYFDSEYAAFYKAKKRYIPLQKKIDLTLFQHQEIPYPYSDYLPVFRTTHPDCLAASWGILPATNLGLENLNPDFPLVLP